MGIHTSTIYPGCELKTTIAKRLSPNPATRQAESSQPRVQQPQQQPAVHHKQVKRPSATPSPAYRTASQSTASSSSSSTERSDWHRVSYGRHSSDWIFTSQSKLKRQSTGNSSQYSTRS